MNIRVFRTLPADPLSFWQRLHPNPVRGFYFGPVFPTALSPVYFSADEPTSSWETYPEDSVDALTLVERALKKKSAVGNLPRFVGILGFAAARRFDPGFARHPLPPDPLNEPEMRFGDFPAVVKLDFIAKQTIVVDRRGEREFRDLCRRTEGALKPANSAQPERDRKKNFSSSFSIPSIRRFSSMVTRAKAAIREGDIYQANLSLRLSARWKGDPVAFYRRLGERNPSPYSALIKWKDRWLVSSSPEFLLRTQGPWASTRPIAGTRPRGKNREEDRQRRGQLLLSPKERAEHIMLVDLERNDLGRVCAPGTVRVPERFSIERYSHVMHIVSEVRGRLKKGQISVDALRALFPGGTITGCPKIRSTEIIEKIEGVSRGPFYGSAGFFCDNRDAVFNILIRTALLADDRIHIQAGAGIVADSHPVRERTEVLAKARALMETARRRSA